MKNKNGTTMPRVGTLFVCNNTETFQATLNGDEGLLISRGDLVEVTHVTHYCVSVKAKGKALTHIAPTRFHDRFVRASSPEGKRIMCEEGERILKQRQKQATMDARERDMLPTKRRDPKPDDPYAQKDWARVGDRLKCKQAFNAGAQSGTPGSNVSCWDYAVNSLVQVTGLSLTEGTYTVMNPLTGTPCGKLTKLQVDQFFNCIDQIETKLVDHPQPAAPTKPRFASVGGSYELAAAVPLKAAAELTRVVNPGPNDSYNQSVTIRIDNRYCGGVPKDILSVSTYEHKVGVRNVNIPLDGLIELLQQHGLDHAVLIPKRGTGAPLKILSVKPKPGSLHDPEAIRETRKEARERMERWA